MSSDGVSEDARTIATMCGIAGYSLKAESGVDRTLAAQALLAGIAERGADAVGYAYRCGEAAIDVHKQRSGASALLEQIVIPNAATDVLVHVRDYTKGHPTIEANNHPIRHGPVVGIHNGIIFNDDELLAGHECARRVPGMTVDSEAIFALAAHSRCEARALEALRGSMAAAWLDERRPDTVFVTRGVGRPLWLGTNGDGTFFASTERALGVAEGFLRVELEKRELPEGTLAVLAAGRVESTERFEPDRQFEEKPLPSVRAPLEGSFCLARLAALAAAAS
jgi:glucosamine 6-phosphate synthetase-like amidotransferase/phosphosugar isomerase protein